MKRFSARNLTAGRCRGKDSLRASARPQDNGRIAPRRESDSGPAGNADPNVLPRPDGRRACTVFRILPSQAGKTNRPCAARSSGTGAGRTPRGTRVDGHGRASPPAPRKAPGASRRMQEAPLMSENPGGARRGRPNLLLPGMAAVGVEVAPGDARRPRRACAAIGRRPNSTGVSPLHACDSAAACESPAPVPARFSGRPDRSRARQDPLQQGSVRCTNRGRCGGEGGTRCMKG